MPYTSYFSNAETAAAQWKLGIPQAEKVCETWADVCAKLNGTYADAEKDDAKNFFTQQLPIYDDPSTKKAYNYWDREITEDEFKKLVDIQRGLSVLRGLSKAGVGTTAREDYKTIWTGIKTRVGPGAAAEGHCDKFNATYCPDELFHYVHYLAKSDKPPSRSKKPYVFKEGKKLKLRLWYKKSA
jgi:hypothetical protein